MADVDLEQSAVRYWKDFDSAEIRTLLAAAAADVSAHLEDSDASKRRLLEQAEEFQSSSSEDIRLAVAPLIRCFEAEIDAISKHSRIAKGTFLSIYKKLIHMPDTPPVPESSHQVEPNHQCQRSDAEEKEDTGQSVEAADTPKVEEMNPKQTELTVEELKAKLASYEKNLAAIVEAQMKTKERELEERFEQRTRHLEALESSVVEKLKLSEYHADALHSALKSAMSELDQLRSKLNTSNASSSDLERESDAESVLLKPSLQMEEDDVRCRSTQSAVVSTVSGESFDRTSLGISSSAQLEHRSTPSDGATPGGTTPAGATPGNATPGGAKRSRKKKAARNHIKDLNAFSLTPTSANQVAGQVDNGTFDGWNRNAVKYEGGDAGTEAALNFASGSNQRDLVASLASSFSSSAAAAAAAAVAAATAFNGPPVASSQVPSPSLCGLSNDLVRRTASVHSGSFQIDTASSSAHPTGSLLCPATMDMSGYVKMESMEPDDALDTSAVALRIRDILLTHNIGQRQFAKQVLNLSQGTVSELLSKPKPWDKLTEKGRESYRKMQLWANDDTNILELKMSVIKNGHSVVHSGYRHDNSLVTEQRVAQILFQAQAAMLGKDGLGKKSDDLNVQPKHPLDSNDPVPNSVREKAPQRRESRPTGARTSPLISVSGEIAMGQRPTDGASNSGSSNGASNNSQSMVIRIYREQLHQLIDTAEKNGNLAEAGRYRHDLQMSLMLDEQNHQVAFGEEDVQSFAMNDGAFKARMKELARPTARQNSGVAALDFPEDLSFKKGPGRCASASTGDESVDQPRTMLGQPETQSNPSVTDSAPSADDLSPLEQMQYIANSLVSKSPPVLAVSGHSVGRAALSPITQDQWDRCADLNTDEVVQRVKDMLSEFSISQRLFGEHVLGLSQGSVSDLLARPKPWHMLTQKGREPFVRMRCFLEDPSSVHNLVSNQYRVPADKFLRSNSASYAEPVPQERKKRKNSLDESLSDSQSSQQKKTRVSFTEEQKEALLQAYEADQYPSQTTIEQLASDLGIQEKTVINWFHNHRMRDKNRFMSWSPGGSSSASPGILGLPIKTELLEDFSSQSCDSAANDFGRVTALLPSENSMTDAMEKKPLVGGEFPAAENQMSVEEDVGSGLNSNCLSPPSDSEAATGKENELVGGTTRANRATANGVSKRKSARPQRLNSEFVQV